MAVSLKQQLQYFNGINNRSALDTLLGAIVDCLDAQAADLALVLAQADKSTVDIGLILAQADKSTVDIAAIAADVDKLQNDHVTNWTKIDADAAITLTDYVSDLTAVGTNVASLTGAANAAATGAANAAVTGTASLFITDP